MKLDDRLTMSEIRYFAARIAGFNPAAIENLVGHGPWNNDQSDQFYLGLLHGMVAAMNLLNVPGAPPMLPVLVGFAADKVLKKEIV